MGNLAFSSIGDVCKSAQLSVNHNVVFFLSIVREHLTVSACEFFQSTKVVSAPRPSSSRSRKKNFGGAEVSEHDYPQPYWGSDYEERYFKGTSAIRRDSAQPQSIFGFATVNFESTSATPHKQSDQSFSEGSHFWEVDASNAGCWQLGIVCDKFKCCLEKSSDYLRVFLAETEITRKESPTALTAVRVELDCRRNTLSFYDASVKAGDPAESLRLIETVSIPSNYPVRATFGVSEGYMKLL